MINAVIDASLFTEDGLTTDGDTFYHPLWTSKEIVDGNWYEPTFTLDHQSALDAFLERTSLAGIAAESDPIEITSTQVTWGNTTNGMVMSGANLSGISDIEQLEAALEGGTGQGEFDTIKVYDNGTEILSLTLAEQSVTILTGGQSLTFHGALPQTFQEIFDFLGHIPNLEMLGDLDTADFNALETFLSEFSLTGFEIADDGETFLGLDVTADMVHLELEGAIAELDGTFPVANLGAFVTTLNTIVTTDNVDTLSDFNAIDGIALTGMRIINDAGTTLADIQLTDGASRFDVVSSGDFEDDIQIQTFEDDEGNVIDGTYSLGAGHDEARLDFTDYYWEHFDSDKDRAYHWTIDGGEDWDEIKIDAEYLYVGPDPLVVNFESGKIEAASDGVSFVTADISNFEALSIGATTTISFIGDDSNNRLDLWIEPEYFEFDGGEGLDQLVLSDTKWPIDDEYLVEGITYDDFLENYTIDQAENGDLQIFRGNEQIAKLISVEEIHFLDPYDENEEVVMTTNEIWGISDTTGTEGDDELFGNSSGNLIEGLGGDDDIYGNGGKDTLIGGAGDDELHIEESASHVDGGEDRDRLSLVDLEDVSGNQEVTIVTDGSDGTVTWGTGEDAIVSTFENIESFEVEVDRWVNLTGSSNDDRIYVRDYHGLTFDGGDGIDRIDFKGLDYYDEEGNRQVITRAFFEDVTSFDVQENGDIWVREDEEGDVVLKLSSVEEIRFYDPEQDSIVVSTNELFDIPVSTGTEGDDELFGNSSGNLIEGLGGDDDIYGNGGNDTLIGGAGHDDLQIYESASHVDGGDDWDRLFLFDLEDVPGSQEVTIVTDGSDGTVTWGTGEDALVSTFENIEAFKIEVDRWVNLTGSGDDDRIYIRNVDGFAFDGGEGIDRVDMRGVDTDDENGNRVDLTQELFEDQVFVEVQENGDVWFNMKEDNSTFAKVTDVEEFKFSDGTEDGNVVSTAQLVENMAIGQNVVVDVTEPVLDLGAGDDTVTGSSVSDNISTGTGDDTIDGGEGDDAIVSGEGNDTVDGGAGDDNLNTGEGSDSVLGGEGNDSIFDATGDDTIDGGEGSDTGVSLSGNNTFEDVEAETAPDYSPEIDDFYCGGSGNDVFRSGDGNDIIIGDVGSVYYFGNDVLLGGRGNDVLQAGYGADTFEFRAGDGDDVIGRVDLDALMSNWPSDIADVPMLNMADFEIGIDEVKLISFSGVTDAASFQTALTNGTMSISNNANGNAVFDSGNGTITFNEIDANDLTVDHFVF